MKSTMIKKILILLLILLVIPVVYSANWEEGIIFTATFSEDPAGATTLYDNNFSAVNGTLTGAATSVDVEGGKALNLSDQDDYWTSASTTITWYSFTICFDIQRNANPGTLNGFLLRIGDSIPYVSPSIRQDDDGTNAGKPYFQYRNDGSSEVSLYSSSALSYDEQTVCYIRGADNTRTQIYIDGINTLNSSTYASDAITTNNKNLVIASFPGGTRPYAAAYDTVRIWDRALTGQEMTDYNLSNRVEGGGPITELTAYNFTSCYANHTTATGTDVAYCRDNTPTGSFTLSAAADMSCGIYNLNYAAMIANNSDTQAATEDTTNHTCTLPDSEQLMEGLNTVYVAIQGTGSVLADNQFNVSLDWNFSGIVKDTEGTLLEDVRVLVTTIADGGIVDGPLDSNSTDITDSDGIFTAYVAFSGNYSIFYEYTNTTAYNSSGLGPYECKDGEGCA